MREPLLFSVGSIALVTATKSYVNTLSGLTRIYIDVTYDYVKFNQLLTRNSNFVRKMFEKNESRLAISPYYPFSAAYIYS